MSAKAARTVRLCLAAVACFVVWACTSLPAKTVIDTAGNVCQVVVAAVDPALGPICTTAQAIADAIAALLAEHAAAGITGAQPSQQEIYNYLLAHGATRVAQ